MLLNFTDKIHNRVTGVRSRNISGEKNGSFKYYFRQFHGANCRNVYPAGIVPHH